MKTTIDNKNTIIRLLKKVVNEMKHLDITLLENSVEDSAREVIVTATTFFDEHLSSYDSSTKREKQCLENEKYVNIRETAVGTHWTMKAVKDSNTSIPRRVQSTLEYIPIVETITSLFKDEQFKQVYLQHNKNHICVNGRYEYFCCGNVFKNTELFQNNPFAIQVQLATDDFEVADPLGSRASVYKITAVYMRILNIPRKYRSKLNNIQLVCLCLAGDLKTCETDFNNIWDLVVRDLRTLETVGIDIGERQMLRGSLVLLCFDNLGGNICLGMAESFNTHYYCRICECAKEQCKSLCKEIIEEYRTKEKYAEQIRIVADSEKVDYKQKHQEILLLERSIILPHFC